MNLLKSTLTMRIKKILLSCFLLSAFSFYNTVLAQTRLSADAEKLYREEQFEEAAELYTNILKSFPSNAIYRHRLGVCLFEINRDLNEAERHLKYAVGKGIKLSNFYLAKIKFQQYEFDKAIEYYNTFKNYIRRSDPRNEEISKGIELCQQGKALLRGVEDIEVLDTIIVPFTYFYRHYKLGRETGTLTNNRVNGDEVNDSLYALYIPEKADRSFFSDKVNDSTLHDLFRQDKLLDEWSEPKALNSVNSAYNDIFPFLMADGLTMYFSSNRHNTFGGYDIFVTRYNPSSNEFLPPQAIGMPFNSYGNDYLYVVDEFNNIGWLASDRHSPKGYVTIYKFKPNKTKRILKTTDTDELRAAALLHSVNPASLIENTYDTNIVRLESEIEIPSDDGIITSQEPENYIHFIVNDTTIYNKLTDFKNRDALLTFKDYLKCVDKKDSLVQTVAEYRKKYEENEDEINRRVLSKNILNSEDKLLTFENRLDSLEQRARKLEIDALRAYFKLMQSESEYQAPWKQKPLEINIPKNIQPSFYNPYLSDNYKTIFSDIEINALKEVEKTKLIADNLVLDWQEILSKLNKNPNADRLIVEKLIQRDSAFAEPITRQQLAIMADAIQEKSTIKYFESLKGKYDILNNKSIELYNNLSKSNSKTTIKKMQEEAEFQYYNASSKTINFSDIAFLNFDETREALRYMESANEILERSIIVFCRFKENEIKISTKAEEKKEFVITYKVQIGLFKNKPNERAISKIPPIISEPVENSDLTRYLSGEFNTQEEAKKAAKEIESVGFPGAFVVPFINGRKATWNEIQNINK